MAVSPFSKPHYVSHPDLDHTSVLAFIEKRFLAASGVPLHLTARDESANAMLDLFDFKSSPSLNTTVTQAGPPAVDCTPVGGPPGTPCDNCCRIRARLRSCPLFFLRRDNLCELRRQSSCI